MKVEEIWKPLFVKGKYFSNYTVSNFGRIINIYTNIEVKPFLFRGVYTVGLYENYKTTMAQVHRIVAETFIENPKNCKFVLFKDNNKANFRIDNLFWCDNRRGLTDEEILEEKREKHRKAVTRKRKYLKERAVAYKGGKCLICGYNRCMPVLEFHHLNPEEKDFAPASMYSKKWSTVLEELDKCVLLCSNCHREVEVGFVNYDLYKLEELRKLRDL